MTRVGGAFLIFLLHREEKQMKNGAPFTGEKKKKGRVFLATRGTKTPQEVPEKKEKRKSNFPKHGKKNPAYRPSGEKEFFGALCCKRNGKEKPQR